MKQIKSHPFQQRSEEDGEEEEEWEEGKKR